jgi:hypothetical protein
MSFLWNALGMTLRVNIGFDHAGSPAANDSALCANRLPLAAEGLTRGSRAISAMGG